MKGQIETRTFDALGRQTGLQYNDGTRVTRTFDAVGRMLTEANQNGIWTRTYDALGRLVTELAPNSPSGRSLTSVYL
jgi:YD repeat-containing protein